MKRTLELNHSCVLLSSHVRLGTDNATPDMEPVRQRSRSLPSDVQPWLKSNGHPPGDSSQGMSEGMEASFLDCLLSSEQSSQFSVQQQMVEYGCQVTMPVTILLDSIYLGRPLLQHMRWMSLKHIASCISCVSHWRRSVSAPDALTFGALG